MARKINVKKGFDLKLRGQAPKQLVSLSPPPACLYACVPDDIEGLIPKMSVKVGDRVLAGDPLMHHKSFPEMHITSPVSGQVVAIHRGAKRKILRVEVQADATQEYRSYPVSGVLDQDAAAVKSLLLESGLWTMLRQRPYDIVPTPEVTPRDIFVTACHTAPLAPEAEYLLEGREEEFYLGLRALSRLTTGRVYVGVSPRTTFVLPSEVERVEVSGVHPAGNVGVLINYTKPVNKGEVVWTAKATDVAMIGHLLQTGQVDYTRRVALTGSHAAACGYLTLRGGCALNPLSQWTHGDEHVRMIDGDVLTGAQILADSPYLSLYSDQITVIPEGDTKAEILGWAMPRLQEYSRSRSYLNWLMPRSREYVLDARVKGGRRAMIMSHELQSVCPLDIMVEPLLKAILAFDIDKMEQLGIYEVAPEDFALSEFVDTSKMPLQQIVREGLTQLYKEMN